MEKIIAGEPERSPIELGIAIVDLAISQGFDIEVKIWEEDKPKFLLEDADQELLEQLEIIADFSLQFLEKSLPPRKNYFVDKTGLFLKST